MGYAFVERTAFVEVADVELGFPLKKAVFHLEIVPNRVSSSVRVYSHVQIELILRNLNYTVKVSAFKIGIETKSSFVQ